MIAFDIIARTIAAKANECCSRSDGFQEELEVAIKMSLVDTWNAAIEAAIAEASSYDSRFESRTLADVLKELKK